FSRLTVRAQLVYLTGVVALDFLLYYEACFVFFFHDTATTETYTLSLTTLFRSRPRRQGGRIQGPDPTPQPDRGRHRQDRPDRRGDRKSTRLNSSHVKISYAVFCLKKKKARLTTTKRSKIELETTRY